MTKGYNIFVCHVKISTSVCLVMNYCLFITQSIMLTSNSYLFTIYFACNKENIFNGKGNFMTSCKFFDSVRTHILCCATT